MKITRAQLKQIIKEELNEITDWTPEMQRRANLSPGGATRSTAPDTNARDKAEAVLSNMSIEYYSLSDEDKALFEEALVAGVNAAVVAWQKDRVPQAREKEAGY